MLPLYLARIEDLGRSHFVKVDCAACHHVALLTPVFLLELGLSPLAKVLDLKQRVWCRGCGARGRAVVSIKWRTTDLVSGSPTHRGPLALLQRHGRVGGDLLAAAAFRATPRS